MDIGTIEGALKLKNEGSAVVKQFQADVVQAAAAASQAIASFSSDWEKAINDVKKASAGGFAKDIVSGAQEAASAASQAAQAVGGAGQAAATAGQAAAAGGGGFSGLANSMLGSVAVGTTLGNVLSQLAQTATALLENMLQLAAQGFRQSVSDATEFQSALTKIINLTNETKESVAGMGQEVLGLSGKVGIGPQELAEGLYFVAGAGIHGKEAMDVLTHAAEASAIGLGKTEDIARALTGVLNAFQGQNLSAADATRVLIATVNEGNVEASELATVLGRVVGQAGEVGASFADVGAFIATFTRVGVHADEAATALRGLFSVLIKPAKQSREALDEIGLSVDQLRQSVADKGLTQTLLDLYKAFDGNLDAMGKVIPNVRALAGFLATAGEQGKQYKEIQENINAAQRDSNYITERMNNLQETLGFQWKSLKADAQAVSVEVGEKFLPALTEVVKTTHDAVSGIGELSKVLGTIVAKVFTITVDLTFGQLKGVKGAVNLASAPGGVAGAIGAWLADEFGPAQAPKTDIFLPAEPALFTPNSNFKSLLEESAKIDKQIAEANDAVAESSKAAAKEADAAAEAYTKMISALTGNDAIKKASDMVTVLEDLGNTKLIDPAQAGNVAKTLQEGIDAAGRFGKSTAEAFGTNTGEVENYVAELQKIATTYKEQEDFGKLTLSTAKADIKAVADEVGGWFTQQGKLNTELDKAEKSLQSQQLDKQSKLYQQYAKDILKTSDELDKLHDEYGNVSGASKKLYDDLIHLKETELDGYFERIVTRSPELRGAIEGLSTIFGGLGPLAVQAFDQWASEAEKATPKTKQAKDTLQELSGAFSHLATVSSGAFSDFAKGIGEIIAVADAGKKAGDTFLKGFKAAISDDGQKAWGDITTNIVSGLIGGIGAVAQATSGKNLIQNIIGGASAGAEYGAAVGSAIALAAGKGAVIGGVWGAAAGAIVGIIIAVWRSSGTRAAMKQVGQEWGVSISEGLSDKLNDLGDTLSGGIDTASILHMADILKEAGGVTSSNIDQFLPKLHDVFSFLERGQITAAQAQGILNDNFSKFADVIVSIGRVAPKAFADVVRLNTELGVNSQAVLDFVNSQTAKLGVSIAALIGPLAQIASTASKNVTDAQAAVDQLTKDGKEGTGEWELAVKNLNIALAQQKQAAIDNQGEFDRLGYITLAAFNAAVAGGLSVYQAMTQIGPSIDALIAAQQQLGLSSDNAALSELEHFRQMVQQNQVLTAAAGALGDTLVALSTIGGLNIDTFKALEDQGVDTFNKLIAAGFSDKEALATIQDYLRDVLDAHFRLGLPIDENTQKLIDQAREYGLLQGDAKTAAQQMHDDLMRVVDAIDRLAEGLGVDVPNAAAQAAEAIGNIPTDITLNTRIGNPGTTGDETQLPAFASGGIVTRPTVGLFGEKGKEAIIPLDRAGDYGLGGTKEQTINLYLDGQKLTSVVVQNMPAHIDLYGGNA